MQAKKALREYLGVAVLLSAFTTPAVAVDFSSLLAGWVDMFNQKVSALKVVTKQEAIAAEKVAFATRDSVSALATAYVSNRQAQMTRDAAQRFGNQGQGVFPCFQSDISLQFADTVTKTALAGQGVSAQMQAAPYGDESARRTDQVALHRGAYCSVSEHKAGLCKVSAMGLQSADADFSMLVKGGTKGSSERSAGYDFIDNVVPVRATAACSSPSCLARLADIRTMNSLDSLARNTLISMIEARSVQNP
jgi:hypothetical protein